MGPGGSWEENRISTYIRTYVRTYLFKINRYEGGIGVRVHVTISLDGDIYSQLSEVPKGDRSVLINNLLAEYFGGIDTQKEKQVAVKKEAKETALAKKDPSIDELIDYWTETTGLPIRSKVALNRANAKTLLRRHTLDEVKQLINGVALAHKDQYAPRKAKCANIIDLQMNENDLLVWGRSVAGEKDAKNKEFVKI